MAGASPAMTKFGIMPELRGTKMQDFDVIVVGAGVAGLTAAMVAARHGLKVAVVERLGAGGQIVNAERIENFPGFPQGVGGHELGPLLHEQAEAAGAEFLLDTIAAIEIAGEQRILHGAADALRAPAVIIAAGSALRSLGVPGEAQFLGRGVSHCASCDGPLFAGREVCVIGGGDSALDEALVLAAHAARVTVFHRGACLRAQQTLVARAAATANLEIVLRTTVEEIVGVEAVTAVRLRDLATGATRLHATGGIFIFVGLEPGTAFLRDVVALDAAGHIETDIVMRTSVAGVFAAGDIRKHSVALLAAAAGDGATAAISAVHYLKSQG
jgi:thioredoxin reductase (NADPH)